MKRALAVLALSLFTLPALAGPILSPAERAQQIDRVRSGARACAGCDLFQADFSYMDLRGRNFSGARLRQADLSLVEGDAARFRDADLSIANLFGARFTGADFTNADLGRAVFVGAYLHGARMSGARIADANFSGAELETAIGLTQAQLDTACGDVLTKLPAGLTIPRCTG